MKDEDWDKFRKIVQEEVAKNNPAATDSVWNEPQTVTLPDGSKGEKSMRQIQRETWQTVKKD